MTHVLRTILFAVVLAAAMGTAVAEPVDINSADADTIAASLKGIGTSKAQAIVAYREANGPFQAVDDLALVKGIGARTVEQNRADITLGSDKSNQ